MLGVLALAVGALILAHQHGFDTKSLLPTGAVLTAVVGLALQTTLGNLIGGLSIQIDKSVRVGDWVNLDGLYGRVSEIRWRATSLETNDYETVVVPNSALLAGKLIIRGRREGAISLPGAIGCASASSHSASPAEVLGLCVKALNARSPSSTWPAIPCLDAIHFTGRGRRRGPVRCALLADRLQP